MPATLDRANLYLSHSGRKSMTATKPCGARLGILAAALFAAACSDDGGIAASAGAAMPGGRAAPATGGPPTQPQGTQRRGLPANALRVQLVEIIDRNGFERPIPAAAGFIPVGWKTQGGVQWGQQFMCTNGYNVDWVASSPDGSQSIAVLPQRRWETNNYGGQPSTPGCIGAAIQSAQQYLAQVVAGVGRGARVTGYRPRPDIAVKFAQFNSRTPSAMGEMRTRVEAGEAQFAYMDKGREMRGVVSSAVIFSLSRMNGAGMGTMEALTGFALPGFAATAPSQDFKPEFVEALRQSFLPNPSWEARIARHNNAIAQVAARESARRSRIISETNDYVSRLRMETAAVKAQSDERRQREFGEAIRGTETYDDPDAPGGRVELSGMYDHAWRLNDGTYVLSSEAGFDPWRDLGVEGKRLDATK